MRRILSSLFLVGVLSISLVGATNAFFQDNETSTGNTLVSGSIDLKVGNTSYYNGEESPLTTWEINDLTNQLFLNFTDIKPGDLGEDTISLEIDNNESWACVDVSLTKNDEGTLTEPESAVSDTGAPEGEDLFDGELASAVNMLFWADDGDNVLETDETDAVISSGTAADVFGASSWVLADSTANNVGGTIGEGISTNETPIYIGKAWCYGSLTQTPVEAGAGVSPLVNPGVSCDGSSVGDASQMDSLMADITIRAAQHRNNSSFTCAGE